MLTHSFDDNEQNAEIAEASGSTGSSTDGSSTSSTGDSTPSVEPVQPLEVPDISGKNYLETNWNVGELKKLLSKAMRKKISRLYHVIRLPNLAKSDDSVIEAEKFFSEEFPNRTPYAVYQKAMRVNRGKFKRIILI